MCGIAGILIKTPGASGLGMTTGEALIEMMDAIVHRGQDSCGCALYRQPLDGMLRLRFFIAEGPAGLVEAERIKSQAEDLGGSVVNEEILGGSYQVTVAHDGDPREFARSMEHSARLVSLGRSVDIIKDVVQPHALARLYNVNEFGGSHGIGHTRLATESAVQPETCHPFWATGFADVSVVHNGQLTNYWIMRRRLQRKGMEFHTENDTELIAVYLAYKMSQGDTLEEALKSSLEDLDGTFSYLVATADSIGYAKDKLAAKPLVKYEDDGIVALASEEVALNRLFPGRTLRTRELPPLTYGLWSRHGAAGSPVDGHTQSDEAELVGVGAAGRRSA